MSELLEAKQESWLDTLLAGQSRAFERLHVLCDDTIDMLQIQDTTYEADIDIPVEVSIQKIRRILREIHCRHQSICTMMENNADAMQTHETTHEQYNHDLKIVVHQYHNMEQVLHNYVDRLTNQIRMSNEIISKIFHM